MNLKQPDAHQRTLFLGDLSSGCNEFDVYKHFQRFGGIEQIKVMKGRGKKVLGYGFITFVKIESAAAAKELDGTMFQGRTLKVGWAEANPNSKLPKLEPADSAQIHFSYLTHQTDNVINEETIRALFSRYGEIKDVAIKKSEYNHATQKQSGYGFLHFPLSLPGIKAALRVTQEFNQVLVNNVLYNCTLTHQLRQILDDYKEVLSDSRNSSPPLDKMMVDSSRHTFPYSVPSRPSSSDYSVIPPFAKQSVGRYSPVEEFRGSMESYYPQSSNFSLEPKRNIPFTPYSHRNSQSSSLFPQSVDPMMHDSSSFKTPHSFYNGNAKVSHSSFYGSDLLHSNQIWNEY